VPSAPSRGPITTRVITELETAGFPVGDNAAPESTYGWSGEPNSEDGSFTPWMSVAALAGTPQRPPGTLGDTGTEWNLPYSVFYAGITRKQCEALADRLRLALTNITRESVPTDSGNWRIQKISCNSVGSSTRVGSAYPDYFTQQDMFEVWITKER
jgi:hypothetical protein